MVAKSEMSKSQLFTLGSLELMEKNSSLVEMPISSQGMYGYGISQAKQLLSHTNLRIRPLTLRNAYLFPLEIGRRYKVDST